MGKSTKMPEKTLRGRISRVLLVEDDDAQRYTLSSIIEREGFEVTSCTTGAEALQHARESEFGVAVVDLRLPDRPGIELLSEIRKINSSVRIILNTAYGSFDSAKEAVNLGAFAYVEKAGDPENLVRHIHRAFHEKIGEYTDELEDAVAQRTASLQRSEARFRALIRTAPSVIVCLLPNGRITEFNPEAERVFGYKKAEVLERSYFDLFLPERIRERVAADMRAVLTGEPVREFESPVRTADGSRRFYTWSIGSTPDDNGQPMGIVAIGQDITTRKQAEEALQRERDFAEELIDTAPVIVLVLDNYGRIIRFNRYMEEISGYCLDEVRNQDWFTVFVPPSERDRIRAVHQKSIGGTSTSGTTNSILTKDGREREIEWHNTHLTDPAGNSMGVLAVGRDVTESRRAELEKIALEEKLRQAHKMEAIGTLASGIAHDFNNILTAILGYATLARPQVPPRSNIGEMLEGIEQTVRHATAVTGSLLTFCRKTPAHKTPIHFGNTVLRSVKMLRPMLPNNIEIVLDIADSDAMWISADAAQIQQIVVNLAINSRDAMPKGGQLRISVRHQALDSAECFPTIATRSLGAAVLTVEDTGCGIDEDLRARIFEPFFTTKPRGRGTGLGLSMVYGVVTDHGGHIEVHPGTEQGARFVAGFPCCDRPVSVEEPDDSNPHILGGDQTILLAEHNQHVRSLVEAALHHTGFKTLSAQNGLEAMRLFEEYQADIRLAVLDADLSKMSGRECLAQIRRRAPRIPAVVISDDVESSPEIETNNQTAVLRRPFRMSELTATVARLLLKVADSACSSPSQRRSPK